MKILWCDDKANDQVEFELFAEEWGLEENSEDLLTAADEKTIVSRLSSHPDIGLVIMDLLWGAQPEHTTTRPLGLAYLKRIRTTLPNVKVVTRSVIKSIELLAALLPDFVALGVSEHFISHDTSHEADLRRRILLETTQAVARHKKQNVLRYDLEHLAGEQWGAILFADVSGFTSMTEQLWHQHRNALCDAASAFYDCCIEVIPRHGGFIDKFIGDEVMALFVIPSTENLKKTEIAESAIKAAREIMNRFRDLAANFTERVIEETDLATVPQWTIKASVEAGTVRILEKQIDRDLKEMCVVGHAVNVAARIKGLSGEYGITIGPTAHKHIRSKYQMTEITPMPKLRNLAEDIRAYTLSPKNT